MMLQIEKPIRKYIPQNLKIDSWSKLEPIFEELKNRSINSVSELGIWWQDKSELEAVLEEDMAWRYIKMSIDTTDEQLQKDFNFFVSEISPKTAPYADAFNRKLDESEFLKQLDAEKYFIAIRGIKEQIKIFREKNIPIETELQQEEQKYGVITGGLSIEHEGKEITMQKAASLLRENNRELRKTIFDKIGEKRLTVTKELDDLYDSLIAKRNQIAKNADFNDYRDYKFSSLGRFDYTAKDCFNFHESIQSEILPICKEFDLEQKQKLGLGELKPWDTAVDASGKEPLKPFETGKELLEKSIACFDKLDTYFGDCLRVMDKLGHLDLESKKGKAPGGFNYPLYEIGVPFIFMNAVGTQNDVITMVHEGGHAVHSFLSRDLELTDFKGLPSEVAELASMSMELISMDHWDVFYDNEEELKRAKKDQLEKILSILPWIALIDKFQHWIYTNPNHTAEQRIETWRTYSKEFSSGVVDWTGYENQKDYQWQKQLHLYEVPFYYIEYGMAQLGAIAVWRNYKQNPTKALQQYKDALALGYTKSISEIYETAGIKFDFSKSYVKELADFVKGELSKL